MSRILREEFFLRRNIALNLPILVETIKTLLFGQGEFVTDPTRRCSPALGQPVLDVHPIPVTFAEGLPLSRRPDGLRPRGAQHRQRALAVSYFHQRIEKGNLILVSSGQ